MGLARSSLTADAPASARAVRFPAYHRWDRTFFLAFLLTCWLGVVMGFWPAVTARFNGQANYSAPIVLQVHVFAFSGWLALLTVQILLIRTLRTPLHKQLGLAGFVLLPVMLVTGYVAEVYAQRFHFDRTPHNLGFFIVPIYYLVAFGVLATAALAMRKYPATHKRLILLATTVIVGAAYARWWGEALFAAFGDDFGGMIVNSFTGTNLIMLAAAAYDLVTRRKVHRVFKIGVPAILLAEMLVSLIYHSPRWIPVAQALIGR